jgi:hypothetical protein
MSVSALLAQAYIFVRYEQWLHDFRGRGKKLSHLTNY